MRIVCAWCLRVMDDGDEPTSHGICEDCTKREFPEVYSLGK